MASKGVLLLPPSKTKAAGGASDPFGATLNDDHPLTVARRQVLSAAQAAATGNDASIARIAGVRRTDVDTARECLANLADAATMPASQRYTGIVHGNAGLPAMHPSALAGRVFIVSALLGLVAADDPVPDYRLEFSASLPEIGGLATFWRKAARDCLASLVSGTIVWDLLPGEHARIWPSDRESIGDGNTRLVTFRFLNPTGRSANAARTKVAKGRLAAALLQDLTISPAELVKMADLGDGWTCEVASTGAHAEIIATCSL
ncbi:MAG: peroxide stress protein YaaA [Nitriliruptoraceae bacterium]